MNIKKAWEILSETLDHGYEGDECEEEGIAEYIEQFEEAIELLDELFRNYKAEGQ